MLFTVVRDLETLTSLGLATFLRYSRTPLIRTLVIRITNYPDRLGPSRKHVLAVIVLLPFMA